MREILFRGKRLDNGEWTQGDLLQLFDGRRYIVANRFGACIDSHGNFINTEAPFVNEVDPATIGQYTGMKDKNGKRIFEGDVLKITWATSGRQPVSTVCSVEYSKSGFFVRENDKLCGQVSNYACAGGGVSVEVIGTVHDNPELLEVRHE